LSSARAAFHIVSPFSQLYTLSLHEALPIWAVSHAFTPEPQCSAKHSDAPVRKEQGAGSEPADRKSRFARTRRRRRARSRSHRRQDRKSTRLNSSHVKISYAVFCLKKKIS